MTTNRIETTLRQDAYDADQYRGIIGASKESRAKAKLGSAQALAALAELIEAAAEFQSETDNGTQACGHSVASRLTAALARAKGEQA